MTNESGTCSFSPMLFLKSTQLSIGDYLSQQHIQHKINLNPLILTHTPLKHLLTPLTGNVLRILGSKSISECCFFKTKTVCVLKWKKARQPGLKCQLDCLLNTLMSHVCIQSILIKANRRFGTILSWKLCTERFHVNVKTWTGRDCVVFFWEKIVLKGDNLILTVV